jgi:hypothetical protein
MRPELGPAPTGFKLVPQEEGTLGAWPARHWERFVREAQLSEAQQQVILSAIHDATLYGQEVDAMQTEWVRETARGDESPFPEVSLVDETTAMVDARAREVLTPEQWAIYETSFRGDVSVAAKVGLVGK